MPEDAAGKSKTGANDSPLDQLVIEWAGLAYRHIPALSPFGILDFRYAGFGDNRWNQTGKPTLYLASDRGVALAEFARHLETDGAPSLARKTTLRQVYRLRLASLRYLDLTDPVLLKAISLPIDPACFLDKSVARTTAEYLRAASRAQGLIVPSVAFLEDPSRKVFVLFLDKLSRVASDFVLEAEPDGQFSVT